MASELIQRIVTGAIAAAIALTLTVYSAWSFTALVAAVTLIAAYEWRALAKAIHPSNIGKQALFLLGFIPYFIPAMASLLWLRYMEPIGHLLVLGTFALVWSTDIAAYAAGRTIGGAKIAPSISPQKTWSGLCGAIIATALIAALLCYLAIGEVGALAPLTGGLVAIVAQAGDFFESWLKRRANVKDSGRIFPGHGGMLDRIDGMIFAAPVMALILLGTHHG